MSQVTDKWEYRSMYLFAELDKDTAKRTRQQRFSPTMLEPKLNRLGEEGWELMHIEPVYIDNEGYSVAHSFGGVGNYLANQYLCVFKRRKG